MILCTSTWVFSTNSVLLIQKNCTCLCHSLKNILFLANNQVSPVKEGSGFLLKTVDVSDEMETKRVQVNLWGDYTNKDVPPTGTRVVVENVQTSTYKNETVLNATQETAFVVRFMHGQIPDSSIRKVPCKVYCNTPKQCKL